MRQRDEARGCRARLAGESLAANLAHHVACLAAAAEDAGADHVIVYREPQRFELGCGALEEALRLHLEWLARPAFSTETDEALTLPADPALAHPFVSGMKLERQSVFDVGVGSPTAPIDLASGPLRSFPRKRGPSPFECTWLLGPACAGTNGERLTRMNVFRRTTRAIVCWPRSWVGRGGSPVFPSLCVPRMRGMARRRGACPGLLQGGPICVRASPDRRALALLRGAPAPLGAPPRHSPQFAFYGGRTCAGPVVPRRGYPAAARVRGCEPRTQVPRPAPLRTTPRPKRPSVDGTSCTYSESHPGCQWAASDLFCPPDRLSFRGAACAHWLRTSW